MEEIKIIIAGQIRSAQADTMAEAVLALLC